MRLIDRLIGRTVISTTLMVALIFFSMLLFMSFVGESTSGDQTVGDGLIMRSILLALLSTPGQFYTFFPIVVFLGILIGLTGLARSSQLIVIQMAGVSRARIAWSIQKAAILMVLVLTVLIETFSPKMQLIYDQLQNHAATKWRQLSGLPMPQSVWLRQGNAFTHIDGFDTPTKLRGVTHYVFGQNNNMRQVSYAGVGRLEDRRWQLEDVKISSFEGGVVASTEEKETPLGIAIHPKMEAFTKIDSSEQTLLRLYKTIQYRSSFGLNANLDRFAFWQRVLQPFITLFLALLAMPFVFGSFRESSAGGRVVMGAMLGVVFYSVNRLFGPITVVSQFPPLLAALMPAVVFGIFVLIFLKKR